MSRIVVTGAGGAAGVAVVQALTRTGHHVVAADCDPDAAGLALGTTAALLPRADAPDFGPAVLDCCVRAGADALITTVAEEIAPLHPIVAALADHGTRTWLPPAGAAAECNDKWAFAKRCAEAGVPSPPTNLGSAEGVPGPWIVKPRFGRGARDVLAADDELELAVALRRVPDPIVQSRLAGPELTVDVLVTRSGVLAACAPRWRLETRGGISTRGETFASTEVEALVGQTVAALGLHGVCCLQAFVDPARGATCTEVNPRFSGGLPLTLAAGCDLVEEYLRGLLGAPVRIDRLEARPGVRMQRYFAELFDRG